MSKGTLIKLVVEVFIGIGANLGKRKENIECAIAYLKNSEGVIFEKKSKIIETKPQGGPPQARFLNAVLKIKTSLSAQDLLQKLQEIEKKLGRKRFLKNGPRTIDLDILLYGDKIINEPNLKIPHPRMFEREFVMKPLLEIAPSIAESIEQLKV